MDHDPDCAGPAMLCTCHIGQHLERRLDAIRAEGRLAKLGDGQYERTSAMRVLTPRNGPEKGEPRC
jgi:hypothetical protein